MGLFDNLMSKIFNRSSAAAGASTSSAAPTASGAQAAQPSTTPSAGPGGGGTATASQQVDVTAILDGLAAKNPGKLDWRHSIVDLMKLVGMDSSLNARKQLATELHYSGDQSDSASMNIWLHKEVIRKLAENGGRVPQELLK
jgi:Domain of unknown function (DUF3597)